jgi:glycerophosphoryl diester phosphodiesterase
MSKNIIMKKLLFLFVILFSSQTIMYSQSATELLVLDNYLIKNNKRGVKVGKFNIPAGEKITLIKDEANLFVLSEDGHLLIKKNATITKSTPWRFEITVKTKDGEKTFELVRDDFIRNKVIAHRGAWKNHDASQNSLKSLKKAIEIGCEGSEFDVWLSSDNKVILSHDPEIGGKKVEETTADELFKIELKDGDKLPSLEEYIKCIKEQNKTRLILEVKASQKGKERCEAVADSAVRIVHRMNAQAWTDYITFSFDAAKRIRELDPTAKILYLEADKTLEELKAERISGIDYHYSNFIKDTDLAKKAKSIGLLTNAWTVNKAEDMQTMLDQDIDYITTDEPEILLEILDAKK